MAKVAFTDKIGDNVDDVTVDAFIDFPHGGLFFPETTGDLTKKAALANGISMEMRGGAGVRVHGGSVTNDDEGGLGMGKRVQETSVTSQLCR